MIELDEKAVKRSRIKLLVVFTMFFGPLFAALIWYYGLGGALAPRSATNHAPLIQPVVTLEPFTNLQLDESELTLDRIKGQWTLVHRLDTSCEEACQTSLYNTRQSRLALGRDTDRVHRILLGSDVGLLDSVVKDHPDAVPVLRIIGGLDKQLIPIIESQQAGQDDALLIDPMGNVMMLIPATLDPSDLLKDLKKLTKLSKVG